MLLRPMSFTIYLVLIGIAYFIKKRNINFSLKAYKKLAYLSFGSILFFIFLSSFIIFLIDLKSF